MYILTLYLASGEPLVFTGETPEAVLVALRRWMNANNGEGSRPRFGKLVCHNYPYQNDIVIQWDEYYGKWCVWWDDDTPRYFAWPRALAAFADVCFFQIAEKSNITERMRRADKAHARHWPENPEAAYDAYRAEIAR